MNRLTVLNQKEKEMISGGDFGKDFGFTACPKTVSRPTLGDILSHASGYSSDNSTYENRVAACRLGWLMGYIGALYGAVRLLSRAVSYLHMASYKSTATDLAQVRAARLARFGVNQ